MAYVIIGGSAAGISAARAIRAREPGAEIKIVTDEKSVPYYRPMIPLLISGERAGAELAFPDDPGKTLGAEIIHARVTRVKTKDKVLELEGGGTLPYKRLLIASGARPKKLDAPGAAGPGVFTLRTMEDSIGINGAARTAKGAVVAGGGFVGVKAAEALAKLGLKVTILEALPVILQPRMDKTGAEIISNALRSKGVTLRTSTTVKEVLREGDRVKGVVTTSGDTLAADIVVTAVGSSPNVEFLDGSGINIETGTVVDDRLETSVPGVYAAGDCAQHVEILSGRRAASALWSNAVEMGRTAGANMAGENLKYPGFLSVKNATEIAGVPLVTIGDVTGGDSVESSGSGRFYRKLTFRDDVLVGAIFMGELRGAGLYATLIANRTPLKGLKDKALEDRLTYADLYARTPA